MLKLQRRLFTLLQHFKMAQTSAMSTITQIQQNPLEMFKLILTRLDSTKLLLMNLATLDSEFGVLNRTVVYRGIVTDETTDANIAFVTERNTQKYKNIKENPKTAVTFLFPEVIGSQGQNELWQVRLFDAEAIELDEAQISTFWAQESVFAKIRSHICECGKPVDHAELVKKHDQLLKDYEAGIAKLDQTKTYTAFKIIPKRWDFYKTEDRHIADRVQYRKESKNGVEQWNIMHVALYMSQGNQ